ncbi:hypothetical protein KKB43_01350 [Patescibacteria group bacterium]|nr:hypothetical protein [Patescibacteria group bacterium]MBU4579641.1 hypothetical protein [Patescibacteria group bacterium]
MQKNNQTKFKETEFGAIPEEWKDGDLFVNTISRFMVQEKFILENDLNERTITHKLAEHIKNSFSNNDVDCEYNRMRSGNADEDYVTKFLNLDIEEVQSNSTNGVTVFPDIVVHERGNNEKNYLVIEVKKKDYAERTRKQSQETCREFDARKLCAYTHQLNYEWGIYLEFDKDKINEIVFFKSGKKYG